MYVLCVTIMQHQKVFRKKNITASSLDIPLRFFPQRPPDAYHSLQGWYRIIIFKKMSFIMLSSDKSILPPYS